PHVWSEFHTAKLPRNPNQVKIDLSKPKQIWYYLGKTSTEAKAQYTEDPRKPRNNLEANFLESVRPLIPIIPPVQRHSYPASYPSGVNMHAVNGAMAQARQRQLQQPQQRQQPQQSIQQQQGGEKPYKYKPRIHEGYSVDPQALMSQRAFQQGAAMRPPQGQNSYESFRAPQATMAPMSSMAPRAPIAPMAPMASTMSGNHQRSPSYMKDFEDYQRESENRRRHEQQQQQHPQQAPRAPVANMMGGSTVSHNPFSNPSPSNRSPFSARPSSSSSAALTNIRGNNTGLPLHPTAKYPYLHYADQKKARVYQSPYAPEGGFTTLWLPNPNHQQTPTPRSSLSQEFLLQRTPSQQEHVHQHVRQLSAGKILQAQMQTQAFQVPHPQYQTSREFEMQVQKEAERGGGSGRSGYEKFFEELRFAGMTGNGSGNENRYKAGGQAAVGAHGG
ncbi:MAG: hypothetical protein M1830_003749, partial [Pleopsidium flavum]